MMNMKTCFMTGFSATLAVILGAILVIVGCGDDGSGPSGTEDIDVTGTWIQTDPCDPLMIFDLIQNGENLTGTARETTGAVLGPLSGTITGDSVYLELSLPLAHWFRYDLTISGDKMSGTWTSSTGMSGRLNMEKTS